MKKVFVTLMALTMLAAVGCDDSGSSDPGYYLKFTHDGQSYKYTQGNNETLDVATEKFDNPYAYCYYDDLNTQDLVELEAQDASGNYVWIELEGNLPGDLSFSDAEIQTDGGTSLENVSTVTTITKYAFEDPDGDDIWEGVMEGTFTCASYDGSAINDGTFRLKAYYDATP